MHRLLVVALSTAALALACSGDTTTVNPGTQTSIVVRAESLTQSLGCGTGEGQVYKYTVSVKPPSDDSTQPAFGAVYDCFADATFTALTASPGGLPFALEIHAFNQAAFGANAGAITAAAAIADTQTLDGKSTWKTKCTATQQANVTVLAVCDQALR